MTIARFINTLLLCLTLLAFTSQLVIDFSTDNIAVNCIILTVVVATLLYFRWSQSLKTHPLSSFAIFGFCVTSEFAALLAQSLAWAPVGTSLNQPLVTFSMLGMYQVIALLAHALYRVMTSSVSGKPRLLRHMFGKLGIYDTPAVATIWVMGGMGLLSLLISRYSPLASGISFLAWSPFLIPIYTQQQEQGMKYCNYRLHYPLLFAYLALIVLVAMAFNARGMMLSGIATVGLLFLLIGMRSEKSITGSMLLKLSAIGLLGAALSWPASNMVTAMAIARGDRIKASSTEMIKKTVENFQSPEKIDIYRKQSLANDLRTAYDEKYVDNPMLARLILTKFHDNTIYFAGKISDKGVDELMKVSGDELWATLPQPWLDALKIDVHKSEMGFSMGDMIVNLAVGLPLGGYRTGSIFGQGWALFGYLFPFIYFGMCLVLFVAIDIFSIRTASGLTALSVIGMLNVWPNFLFGITADSLHYLFMGVVRGVPQSVFLYAIIFYIAKSLSNLILNIMPARASAH